MSVQENMSIANTYDELTGIEGLILYGLEIQIGLMEDVRNAGVSTMEGVSLSTSVAISA